MHAYLWKFAVFCIILPVLAFPALAPARSGDARPAPAISSFTPAPPGATPQGFWMTANRDAIIQIAPCGAALCGDIVGMFLLPKQPTPKDWAGASQCRLTIIQAAPTTDGGEPAWIGHVVDPRDGVTFHATIRLDGQNNLLLRGYVGLPIFGETQTWTPYRGTLAENCRLPQPVG